MKRELFIAAAITAAALETGCSAPGHTAAPLPAATTAEAPTAPTFDMGELPTVLPPAVAHAASIVVSTEYAYSIPVKSSIAGLKESTTNGGALASGFRVAKDTYLSAGHFVHTPSNQPIPYINVCGNITVDGPSNQPTVSGSSGPNNTTYNLYGTSLEADKYSGSYIDGDTTSTPDVAIIHAPDVSGTLPGQPVASIASSPLKVGENVYFINYQPISDKKFRSPFQEALQQLDNISGVPAPALSQPAIYGGIVTGFTPNGNAEVVTGGKTYDSLGDNNAREGSSGGEVVNALGQIVAQSIQLSVYTQNSAGIAEPLRLADFEQQANFKIKGVSSNTMLDEAIIQPVTEAEIQGLERKLQAAPDCVYDPAHAQNQ